MGYPPQRCRVDRPVGQTGPCSRSFSAIKLLVLIFGGVVYTVWANKAPVGFHGWLEIWNHWDGPHYLDIARDGYVTQGDQRNWIVFYPLYPWAIRLFTLVLRNPLLSAFVVSALASVVAGLLLSRLTELDFDRAVSRSAVWFMFIFPTSYFFHIGYTESLFLALALGSFLAARRRAWWLAGVVGALACLTRVNGLVLIPALACEAFLQYRNDGRRRLRAEWLWIAFIGSGFALLSSRQLPRFRQPARLSTISARLVFQAPRHGRGLALSRFGPGNGGMRGSCILMAPRSSSSSC